MFDRTPTRITCVEINPAYLAVGQKIIPEATWVLADALTYALPADAPIYDCAMSNPPFGTLKGYGTSPRYTGSKFEYKVIDAAKNLAEYVAFIIPQMSCPFRYSGVRRYENVPSMPYVRFMQQTGLSLEPGIPTDTLIYEKDWSGVSVRVEVAKVAFRG